MLQKLKFEDDGNGRRADSYQETASQSQLFRPAFYWALIKRRAVYVVIPFVLVLSAGLALAARGRGDTFRAAALVAHRTSV